MRDGLNFLSSQNFFLVVGIQDSFVHWREFDNIRLNIFLENDNWLFHLLFRFEVYNNSIASFGLAKPELVLLFE